MIYQHTTLKKINGKIHSFDGLNGSILLLCLILMILMGCKKLPKSLEEEKAKIPSSDTDTSPPITGPAAETLKSTMPFPIGAAIKDALLDRAIYSNTLISDFNSISAENAMKFGATHPQLNTFNFTAADKIVNFALKNKMRVHGHVLIWPKDSTMPTWLTSFVGTPAAYEALMKTHIETVLAHFKGKVVSWDVVNEAFADDGTLKDNLWLRQLGEDYILKAFQFAHEADPDILLFYNDYGQEFGGRKMKAIMDLVAKAKARNIPIHGLGFQMHTLTKVAASGFETNVNLAATTGLLIHVSELDITVGRTFELLQQQTQATRYKEIFTAYMKIPKAQQFGITTWGVSDKDSFYNASDSGADHPLLFDHDYNPKLAYKSVIDAALGR